MQDHKFLSVAMAIGRTLQKKAIVIQKPHNTFYLLNFWKLSVPSPFHGVSCEKRKNEMWPQRTRSRVVGVPAQRRRMQLLRPTSGLAGRARRACRRLPGGPRRGAPRAPRRRRPRTRHAGNQSPLRGTSKKVPWNQSPLHGIGPRFRESVPASWDQSPLLGISPVAK